jgi:L,D-peptidoglycan transpeptidase YkuD (ErfK/YbiS/YcfS/YnhG family)
MKASRLNRFQLRRMRRTSRKVRVLLALGVVAVATAFALPIATGRTTPRWYLLQTARLAVSRAQDLGADRWATEPMGRAKAMLQVAMVEHRTQELRFLPLRDFTLAEALLREAEQRALQAGEAALRQRRSAREASQEALGRAAQAVRKGVQFADAMHLPAYDRTLLQQARLHLDEAELLQKAGQYSLAAERARLASDQAGRVSQRAAQAAARYVDSDLVQNWRRWIEDTVEQSRRSGSPAIIVNKERHLLTLLVRGRPVRNYVAELGYNSIANKWHAGDAATPEGRYRITAKKGVGQSTYHMALLLDYPNAEDRRRFEAARRAGRVARGASLGNLIEIHGEGGRGRDWTRGCVALASGDIEELFDQVNVGTPVTIVGGDGNGGTYTKLVGLHRASADTGLD